jgi:hypothetical protein
MAATQNASVASIGRVKRPVPTVLVAGSIPCGWKGCTDLLEKAGEWQ